MRGAGDVPEVLQIHVNAGNPCEDRVCLNLFIFWVWGCVSETCSTWLRAPVLQDRHKDLRSKFAVGLAALCALGSASMSGMSLGSRMAAVRHRLRHVLRQISNGELSRSLRVCRVNEWRPLPFSHRHCGCKGAFAQHAPG